MSNLPETISNGELRPISEIFKDGSSRTAYFGRNYPEMEVSIVECARATSSQMVSLLILGSSITDGWEAAAILETRDIAGTVIAVDRDPKISELNQTLAQQGKLALSETQAVLKNPVVGHRGMRKDVDSPGRLLQRFNVKGIAVENGSIVIGDNIRKRVTNINDDIESFIISISGQQFDVIISNNLLNNLIFQGFDYSRMVEIFSKIGDRLSVDGMFEFVHNDEFFHNFGENDSRSLLATLEAANLDILVKATTYIDMINDQNGPVINENASFLAAHPSKELQDTRVIIEAVRMSLSSYSNTIGFLEGSGTLNEFKSILKQGDTTNIALIKTGHNQYCWFNVQGSYRQTFSKLAKLGFYPYIMEAVGKARS